MAVNQFQLINKHLQSLDKRLTKVERTMVTKADAKKFATKKDLTRLERRLRKDMATKDDIKNMATKDDIQRLDFKLWLTEERFDEKLETTFKKYTNIVLTKLDAVMGELKNHREERLFQQAQIERIKEKIGLTD